MVKSRNLTFGKSDKKLIDGVLEQKRTTTGNQEDRRNEAMIQNHGKISVNTERMIRVKKKGIIEHSMQYMRKSSSSKDISRSNWREQLRITSWAAKESEISTKRRSGRSAGSSSEAMVVNIKRSHCSEETFAVVFMVLVVSRSRGHVDQFAEAARLEVSGFLTERSVMFSGWNVIHDLVVPSLLS